jgi:opacity protein-like surface antigen
MFEFMGCYHREPTAQFTFVVALAVVYSVSLADRALAQPFVSPSFGYNFGGDAGCPEVTDCRDKNWNGGISFGALGRFVGLELEVTYEDQFFGELGNDTSVMTLMGNFLVAPRIGFFQPYGLAGFGMIKTSTENLDLGSSENENQIAWTIGGGAIVFVHRNIGLKGEIRHYYSFDTLELLGIELGRDSSKLDFGRGAFGVVFRF